MIGKNNSFTWQVVAGDGNGPVTVSIDTAGGTSFTLLQVAATKIPTVGTYTLTIFVPAGTVCTGTGGLCTVNATAFAFRAVVYIILHRC